MIKAFLFIIALVNTDGSVEVHHNFVDKCPTQQEVKDMLMPLKESGQILGWGGSCNRVTAEMKGA